MATESVEGEEVGGADTDTSPPEPALDPKVVSRRDALKKAAIGAGIAGAVWSAPRIEGLSLVPDYAAAGTVPAGSTIQIKASSADCGTLLNLRNCWGNCIPGPMGNANACSPFHLTVPAYVPAGPFVGTTDGAGGTPSVYNSTVMLSNMAPPAPNQNEFFDVVWSGNADGQGTGIATLMFSLDPPFNMCAVTSVAGQIYPTNNLAKAPWPAPQIAFTNHTTTTPSPAGPITSTTGADANFAPNAPALMLNPQGADITITITCS